MIAPEFMTFLKSSKERRLGVRPTGTWSGRGFSTGDIAAATRSRRFFCIDKTHTRNIKQVVIPNQLAVRISGESLLRKEVGEVAISTNENSKVSSLEITLTGDDVHLQSKILRLCSPMDTSQKPRSSFCHLHKD